MFDDVLGYENCVFRGADDEWTCNVDWTSSDMVNVFVDFIKIIWCDMNEW